MFKLKKHSGGPVLSPAKNLDWEKEGVFNPGVIKDGEEIIMLYRAVGERESYISRLGLAKSRDGINFERVSNDPVFGPGEFFDHWSTEDPRIVKIDNEFLITYVAVADRIMKNGRSILRPLPLETASALLKTKDFSNFEKVGIISPAGSDNKDVVIFPRKIRGRYAMLHRPNRWSKEWFSSSYEKFVDEGLPCPVERLPDQPSVWLAWSDNLKNWTDHKLLIWPEHHLDEKVGAGLPPIETPDGWLLIYHHVSRNWNTGAFIYTARVALADLDNPNRLIAKIPYDILAPDMPYETNGEIKVVFPTGGFVQGDVLHVYYGASDRYVCLATGSLSELLTELKKYKI
ncbi:MAG TPA: glycosidase [Candidatus Paceibacterota bacterium]|nr:glycosidase [Candidatus Paceibacterota bacterium]